MVRSGKMHCTDGDVGLERVMMMALVMKGNIPDPWGGNAAWMIAAEGLDERGRNRALGSTQTHKPL